jgi:hypothetical protein
MRLLWIIFAVVFAYWSYAAVVPAKDDNTNGHPGELEIFHH